MPELIDLRIGGEQFVKLSNPIPPGGIRTATLPDDGPHLYRVLDRLVASEVLRARIETEVDENLWCEGLLLFSFADLEAATRVRQLAKSPAQPNAECANAHRWIRVPGPGAVDDGVFLHENLQVALVDMLEDCLQYARFPILIMASDRGIRFEFDDDVDPAIELRVATPSAPASFAEQPRYGGLMTGLACVPNMQETFLKRLKSLPGWGDVRLSLAAHHHEQFGEHFPIPKEWRSLGAHVLRGAGFEHPTSAQIEEVACAVLDFPSWNHLSAAYKAAASSPAGLLMYRTCYCSGDNAISFEQLHGSLESALHSLISSVQATAQFSLGWEELELECQFLSEQVSISAPNSPDNGTWRMEWAFSMASRTATSDLHSWVRGYFDGRVLTADVLEEIFMVFRDDAERSAVADSLCAMTVLAEVGSRRLYQQPPYPDHDGHRLVVHTTNSDGSRVSGFGDFCSSEDISLHLDSATGFTVMAAQDYGDTLRICTVFSPHEYEMVSVLREHVLLDTQLEADALLAAMTPVIRKAWWKDAVAKGKSLHPRSRRRASAMAA